MHIEVESRSLSDGSIAYDVVLSKDGQAIRLHAYNEISASHLAENLMQEIEVELDLDIAQLSKALQQATDLLLKLQDTINKKMGPDTQATFDKAAKAADGYAKQLKQVDKEQRLDNLPGELSG